MASSDPHQDASRFDRRLIGAAIAAAIAGMLVLAVMRGIWLDELYTLFFAHHDLPLTELYRQRWRIDPHPPLFYTWIWALIGLIGDDLRPLRFANAIGLVVLLAALVAGRRRGLERGYLLLFALLVLSSPLTIMNFAELRSYFLQISFFAAAILFVQMVQTQDRDIAPRRDGGLIAGLIATSVLAANLHYFAGLFCVILLGIAFLREWARGRRGAAALFVVAGIVTLAPLGLAFASYATHVDNSASPMQTPALRGYVVAVAMVGVGFLANAAAATCAVVEARERGLGRGSIARGDFVLTCLAALAAGLLILTTLNLKMHFLIPRYLLPVLPLTAAPVALLAANSIGRRWFALVPANALLLTVATTVQQSTNTRWEYSLPVIRREVQACPQTRVLGYNMQYLYDRDRGEIESFDPRIARTIDYGYPYIAARNGFGVALAPQPGASVRPRDGCPVIVWLESNYSRGGLSADELLALAHVDRDPARPGTVDFTRDGDHALLILRPAR